MSMKYWKRSCLALVLALSASAVPVFARTAPTALRAPLPLEVATQMNTHNGRSPIELSPDGKWVAHTYSSAETVARDTVLYTASGFPLAEGNGRMHAVITHTRTGETIRLGGGDGASWGAVWSPDGRRVAFYSDAGGEAGLWIWEKATRIARRFPGIIVRPFFGFETVRWMADSRRLVSKVLPEDMSVLEANGAAPQSESGRKFRPVGPDEPSVYVLSSGPASPPVSPPMQSIPPPGARPPDPTAAELAVLDVDAGTITRVSEYSPIRYYAFSPDQQYLAYTVTAGVEPNSQQPLYDLMLYSFASGTQRQVAKGIRMAYGLEWNWSPDSRRLAYIESGQRADGAIVVVSLDGESRRLETAESPGFDTGNGILAPYWDARGEKLYAVGKDGKLWRTSLKSGRAVLVGEIAGQQITEIVTSRKEPTIWSVDGKIWVMARAREGAQSGFYGIDPTTGLVEPGLVEPAKQYATYFNLDASDASGEIAYVVSDQQHPFDIWLFDPASKEVRQATHLNPDLERYQLGQARVIEWKDRNGRKLRGTLLLPPGYRQGERLPLVVWVYGGANGSEFVDDFGLWGKMATFNMHILATRGYAILYPDAPVEVGSPLQDIVDAVMPALDAAVAQGYADPERIAVMGQSYGSYSALALICHSTRFKAAVLTGAVVHPDLIAGYLEMSLQGMSNVGYYEEGQGVMGGTPWQYPDRYLDNSPIFLFDRIETPVLIGQGAKDGRLFASDAIFVALRRLGKPVEYRIYEGESHVISRRPNVIDFWQRRIDFLDEHLDVSRVEKVPLAGVKVGSTAETFSSK